MDDRALLYFMVLFIFKYLRLIIQGVSYLRYQPIRIPENPNLAPTDVTVVIATLGKELKALSEGLQCHVRAGIQHISICTPPDTFDLVTTLSNGIIKRHDDIHIHVSQTPFANKREQLATAIARVPRVRKEAHKIIVFADDDIAFPENTFRWMLAAFERDKVGGVGTSQRVRRLAAGSVSERVINWIFADYIARRNFENLATLTIDGSISCLSGRLAGFRSDIVEDPKFLKGFVSETWNGQKLNADDDNYWTRHLLEKGWDINVQCHPECQVETVFRTSLPELWRFVRWQRSNPRSNWRSLRNFRNWRRYSWGTYSLYLSGFVNYGLPPDIMLWRLWLRIAPPDEKQWRWVAWFLIWWLFAKIAKRLPLFCENWRDVVFLPVAILWGWCHDFIKLYALMTVSQTGWE
ncbi:hypothetical protein PV08_06915 [Exophiala spinifera]|uniref:Glycosyltransferase 2-like domain-containing protein n=1 Tax=Exophiala spinifera TaxID=91928 RepID=A0A0D2BSD0_9EURO|nr:uncharacterized protein PV08_06915 [Exophiala spinifera]KIW14134.1 hypothetical protein PV08_06915 [Exophiala spinifera]